MVQIIQQRKAFLQLACMTLKLTFESIQAATSKDIVKIAKMAVIQPHYGPDMVIPINTTLKCPSNPLFAMNDSTVKL